MKKFLPKFFGSKSEDVDPNKIQQELDRQADKFSDEEKLKLTNTKLLPKAKKLAAGLPFVKDLVAGYYCMIDEDVPLSTRAAILAPLVYFVVPIDAVPDFTPVAGYSDDIAVWLAAAKFFGSAINKTHYTSAQAALDC